MSSPHASDLGAVQRNVLDQTEQKQIKEVQDFAQRLSNSQNFDQASESTQESDSVSFLLQDLDPLHILQHHDLYPALSLTQDLDQDMVPKLVAEIDVAQE